MSTRFLGTWVVAVGVLLLLTAAALQFWVLADPDSTGWLVGYATIHAVGGSTLGTLGMACRRIALLEDRVKELERSRESAPVGSNG